MKKLAIFAAIKLCALAAAIASAHSAQAAELTVQVEGQASGRIYLGLYHDEQSWVQMSRDVRGDIGEFNGSYSTTFKDLAPGKYAVAVYIDENGNGAFDRNPAGMPLEKYGVSRDAKGNMGPPLFQDAAIDLNDAVTTTITLR